MRILRLSAALFAAAIAACLALPGTVRASPPVPNSLSMPGIVVTPDGVTRLADSSGRVLDLRGFNLDKYDESSPDDVRAIAERGFNLIRLDITWGLGTGGYAPLDKTGNPLPGEAPMFVPFASAVAGTATGSSFDAASRTYTLSYLPGGRGLGVTEIVLPASVYSDRVAVSISGSGRAMTVPPAGPGQAGRVLVFATAGGAHQGSITVTVR